MFEDIRPFNDSEAKSILYSTLKDPDLVKTIGSWLVPKLNSKAPWLLQPMIKGILKAYFWRVKTIDDFQMKLKPFISLLMKKTVSEFSVHGLERLDSNKAYLFVSNHRDIVMDPAMICWALHFQGFQTPRLAIGDNLLTLPFSSNLMRLNKSFIVKRNLKGMKTKLKAAQELSKYIQHSILEEQANVWIAQREGRAKDGYDSTNPALIGMFSLSKPKGLTYSNFINGLNIVPVSISYELDPLDIAKARELYSLETKDGYRKRPNEDLTSIARGLTGWKGRVHLEFGEVIHANCQNDKDVAAIIDDQMHRNYRTFETNEWAEAMLNGTEIAASNANIARLKKRVDSARDELKPYILKQYANSLRMCRGEIPL